MFTCACVSGGPMHPSSLPNTENSLYISGLVTTSSCMCHFISVGHTMGIWGGMSGFNLLGGVREKLLPQTVELSPQISSQL